MNNPAKASIFNLANFISIVRMFLSIPLVFSLENQLIISDSSPLLIVLFLIVISDVLDGYVARKLNVISNFGKLLDPIADKICLMVAMIFLIFNGDYKLPFLLFFILLSIRDVYIIIIGVYLIHVQNTVFQANKSGKYFMGCTVVMMSCFVFKLPINLCWFFYIIALILMVISGYDYHNRYIKYFNRVK